MVDALAVGQDEHVVRMSDFDPRAADQLDGERFEGFRVQRVAAMKNVAATRLAREATRIDRLLLTTV